MDDFNPQIAHIQHGDRVFQVLNADGNDWDEAATRAAYLDWLATHEGNTA
jgi:hypothetical protein